MTTTHIPFSYPVGDTWVINAMLNDSAGNPLDLTTAISIDWTLTDSNNNVAIDLNLSSGITLGSGAGSCIITIPATVTQGLAAGNYVDKVVVVMPGDFVSTQFAGPIEAVVFNGTLSPQLSMFRQWFPEFSTVDDISISQSLMVAGLWIDPSKWSKKDYPMAILYWAAHWTQLLQTQLATMEIAGTGSTDIFLRQVRMGERSFSFQQRSGQKQVEAMAAPGESLLSQTIYGQLFIQLRARNIPAVMVV